MRITESQLRRIIRQEAARLTEAPRRAAAAPPRARRAAAGLTPKVRKELNIIIRNLEGVVSKGKLNARTSAALGKAGNGIWELMYYPYDETGTIENLMSDSELNDIVREMADEEIGLDMVDRDDEKAELARVQMVIDALKTL